MVEYLLWRLVRTRPDQKKKDCFADKDNKNTHDVDHRRQEVDEDGDEDDDVPRRVRLVDPAAGLPQDQRQTLVILRRGDEDQAGVEDDEDGKLDHHGNHSA